MTDDELRALIVKWRAKYRTESQAQTQYGEGFADGLRYAVNGVEEALNK